MKFIVLLEDNPSADPDIRKMHMSDHLAFLDSNSEKIEAAGPLSPVSGEGAGGLWVVDAEPGSEVERLTKNDPFWPTGLRKSFVVWEWKQVYADGWRLI